MKQKYIHPQTEIVKMLGDTLMGDKASYGGHFGNAKEMIIIEHTSDDNDFWIDNSSSKSIWED